MEIRDERASLRERAERAEAELAATRSPHGSASRALVGLGLLIVVGAVVVATTQPTPLHGPLLPMMVGLGLMLVQFGVVFGFVRVATPHQLLVISGRRTVAPDGTARGYRLVSGGRTLLVPMLERADLLSLSPERIELDLRPVRAAGGRGFSFEGTALVRFDAAEPGVHRAVERFLGRSPAEVREIAAQTIEGALRGLFAKEREPERFAEDRLAFAAALLESGLEEDFAALGLVLETMHVRQIEATEHRRSRFAD